VTRAAARRKSVQFSVANSEQFSLAIDKNIARFKSDPAPRGPVPNIALFIRRRSARHMVHGGPVGRAAARRHRPS